MKTFVVAVAALFLATAAHGESDALLSRRVASLSTFGQPKKPLMSPRNKELACRNLACGPGYPSCCDGHYCYRPPGNTYGECLER